jgi:hypothetical protein
MESILYGGIPGLIGLAVVAWLIWQCCPDCFRRRAGEDDNDVEFVVERDVEAGADPKIGIRFARIHTGDQCYGFDSILAEEI